MFALWVALLWGCTPERCEVDGVPHAIGESYTCADGCNTCTCELTGVSSTLMACRSPDTDTGGDSDTD